MKVFCEVDRVLRPLKAGRPAKALPSVQTKGIVGFMKTTQVRMMCCLIRIYTRAFMDAPLCARNMLNMPWKATRPKEMRHVYGV